MYLATSPKDFGHDLFIKGFLSNHFVLNFTKIEMVSSCSKKKKIDLGERYHAR